MPEQRVIDAVADAYSFATADATIEEVRVCYDESMARAGVPDSVSVAVGEVGGVPGRWYRPGGAEAPVVLYLHGGGYLFGSSRSHGPLAARLALESEAAVFVADYRLAPEHQFPAAVEDAVALMNELISVEGANNVVLAGDSAGGGLVLATLLAARGFGHELPAAAVTLSAWTDLAMRSPSVTERAHIDPFLTKEQLDANAVGYLGDQDRLDPLASPVHGELFGLPPIYMQVGTAEILHDDTQRLAAGIRAVGGSVTVEVQDGMPHVHQILLRSLPEAASALSDAGQFIRAARTTQQRSATNDA